MSGGFASGGIRILNQNIIEQLALHGEIIDYVTQMETVELNRRIQAYRGNRPLPNLTGQTVIIADDGIATGATLFAAIRAVRAQAPARIVIAVGVAPPESYRKLATQVDELVCILQPEPFWSVGVWFEQFDSTKDEEVRALLAKASG